MGASARRHTVGADDDGEAQVVVLVGTGTGRRLKVGEGITLGRGEADLVLTGDGISRRHATITRRADRGYEIRDLNSRNGTYVNGLRVETGRLQFGDRIAVGSSTVLIFAGCDPVEDQLVQSQKLQMLGELAGGIAHDFNNLLAAMLSSAGYLRATLENPTPNVAACLEDIDYAAKRARDLTSQLLAFAHDTSFDRTPVPLSEIVDDAVRIARRLVKSTVHLQVRSDTDAKVQCDRTQLLQVVMNLCVNGSDAMPEGGTLSLSVSVADRDDPDILRAATAADTTYVVASVVDEGVGISKETLDRVFEPFFTTKARGTGTGLGLATAQRTAREHGGFLTVHSVVGEGSEFRLFMPTTAAPGEQRPRQRSTDATAALRGTILLVEDERVVRSATTRVLSAAGLDVITAETGLAAVECFRDADAFDVILLDLDLPHLTGDEVLEVVRERDPDVDVLVCSGALTAERKRKLEACGVTGFLAKPYDSVELVACIEKVLATRAGL